MAYEDLCKDYSCFIFILYIEAPSLMEFNQNSPTCVVKVSERGSVVNFLLELRDQKDDILVPF